MASCHDWAPPQKPLVRGSPCWWSQASLRAQATPGKSTRVGGVPHPALGSALEMLPSLDKFHHPSCKSTRPAGNANPYPTATAGLFCIGGSKTSKRTQADTTCHLAKFILMPKHHQHLCLAQLGVLGVLSLLLGKVTDWMCTRTQGQETTQTPKYDKGKKYSSNKVPMKSTWSTNCKYALPSAKK